VGGKITTHCIQNCPSLRREMLERCNNKTNEIMRDLLELEIGETVWLLLLSSVQERGESPVGSP
jgi:hypothetical protein